MPATLLARFRRATAEQVIEHIDRRMAVARQRGFRARRGPGAAAGSEGEFALGFLPQFAPMGLGPAGAPRWAAPPWVAGRQWRCARLRSAQWPAPAARACPVWAAWRAGRLADICNGRRGGAGWLQADGRRARRRPVRLDGGGRRPVVELRDRPEPRELWRYPVGVEPQLAVSTSAAWTTRCRSTGTCG